MSLSDCWYSPWRYFSRSIRASSTATLASLEVAEVLAVHDLVVFLGLDPGGPGLLDEDLLVLELVAEGREASSWISRPAALTGVPSSRTQRMEVDCCSPRGCRP